MVASQSTIIPTADRLTHEEACRLCGLAYPSSAQTIVLDFGKCYDASTAGFARLVLLRRALLAVGRDIWIAGLHDRPAHLFEVHRLDSILPRISSMPSKYIVQPEGIAPRLAGEVSAVGAA